MTLRDVHNWHTLACQFVPSGKQGGLLEWRRWVAAMGVMFARCGLRPKRTVFRKRGDRPTISKDRCNYPDVTLYYRSNKGRAYVRHAIWGHKTDTGPTLPFGANLTLFGSPHNLICTFLHFLILAQSSPPWVEGPPVSTISIGVPT